MTSPAETDIVPVLKKICLALQPSASNRNIKLDLTTAEEKIQFCFVTTELMSGFAQFISAVIGYMPDNNMISITAELIEKNAVKYASVKIKNTGINLKMVTALIYKSSLPVTLYSFAACETTFEVCYALSSPDKPGTGKDEYQNAAPWNYIKIIHGIKSHFAKLNNPVARLAATKPKEAVFLTKIIQCILQNIDNEQFDANALSHAMSISRAQLLRRMKSLTGNSPGYYIKTMRLEKAKELLETSDVSISEAAFQTGFTSPSHFSKVFSEKYGMTPSQFLRLKRNETNEQVIATNAITAGLLTTLPL